MPRTAINPESMYPSVHFGFSQATKSNSATTIHCSGQVAFDKNGEIVGVGDLAAQTKQSLENLKMVLAEAGATVADVVRMRTYVVDHKPEYLEVVLGAIGEFYGDEMPAANTFIGVQALALPELLVEIEITAQID